jgi:hypothetical protein
MSLSYSPRIISTSTRRMFESAFSNFTERSAPMLGVVLIDGFMRLSGES